MLQHDITIQNKQFADLNPLIAGEHYCDKGYKFGPYKRNYYLIHYVVSGEGVLFNHDKNIKYDIKHGQIFIIRPGEKVTYTASETDPWRYIWIGFNGERASLLNDKPDICDFDNFNIFLDILNSESISNTREEFLTAQIYLIFTELFKSKDTGKPNFYTSCVKNYIENNYMLPLSVSDIAKNVNLSRVYLSRIFKADYNISIKEYIIKVKMEHAKSFLIRGSSVSETAQLVGYNDVFNFSKAFKSFYGMSPKEMLSNKNIIIIKL